MDSTGMISYSLMVPEADSCTVSEIWSICGYPSCV